MDRITEIRLTMVVAVGNGAHERLFEQALDRIKVHGVLEYQGEFGGEIANFIPFVNWLYRHEYLRNARVSTYRGMEPFYFFLQPDQILTRNERRTYLAKTERWWPGNDTHADIAASPFHSPPDYRAKYAKNGFSFDRPIIFIQNKFSAEWDVGPVNYLSLRLLRTLFGLGAAGFSIVYSRPLENMPSGFSQDHNFNCDYPDYALAECSPHVTCLDRLDLGDKYNETKLAILAKCRLFLSVQGGSTHLLAYFGDSVLIVNHVVGPEFPKVYFEGRYTQLSSPPPKIFLFDSRTADHNNVVGFFSSLRVRGVLPALLGTGGSCEVGPENLNWLEPLTDPLWRPGLIPKGLFPFRGGGL